MARAWWAFWAAGCGAGTVADPRPAGWVDLGTDPGRACLFGSPVSGGSGGGTSLVPGEPTSVVVELDPCVPACATETEAWCAAAVSGTTLVVRSGGGYLPPPASAPCAEGCEPLVAACAGPILGSGVYQLLHGGRTTLQVPGEGEVPCAP